MLTLIGQNHHLAQILLQNLQGAQLLFLVFDNGLGRDQLLRHARGDQDVVLLGDFDAALLGVELTDAHTVAGLFEVELLGLVPGKVDDIQPAHGGALLAMGLEHPWRPVEQALKAFDQDGPQRSGTEVASHALMSLQHPIVIGHQRQQRRKRILGRDERKRVFKVSGQVIDLQVVGLGFGHLERRGGLHGGIDGETSFSFGGDAATLFTDRSEFTYG